jgi:UDP-glucose 4-epimerase
VVGIFIRKALCGEELPIFGDGKQERAFSYIDDVAPLIADAPVTPQAQNQTFNVGGETPFSVNDLALEIFDAMQTCRKVRHLPARNEVQQVYASPAKLRQAFGITAEPTSLKAGIEQMVAWAKTQTLTEPKQFADIEVDWKLPDSWAAMRK